MLPCELVPFLTSGGDPAACRRTLLAFRCTAKMYTGAAGGYSVRVVTLWDRSTSVDTVVYGSYNKIMPVAKYGTLGDLLYELSLVNSAARVAFAEKTIKTTLVFRENAHVAVDRDRIIIKLDARSDYTPDIGAIIKYSDGRGPKQMIKIVYNAPANTFSRGYCKASSIL